MISFLYMYRSAKLREEPKDHFGRATGKQSTRLEMGKKKKINLHFANCRMRDCAPYFDRDN